MQKSEIKQKKSLFPPKGKGLIGLKSQLAVEFHVRNDIGAFRAERLGSSQRLIDNSLGNAPSAKGRNRADRLHIGVIGGVAVPQTAVSRLFARPVNGSNAQIRVEMRTQPLDWLIRFVFPFKCRSVCAVVKSLPQKPQEIIQFQLM